MKSPAFVCSIAHPFTLLTAFTLIIGIFAPAATFCLSAGFRRPPHRLYHARSLGAVLVERRGRV